MTRIITGVLAGIGWLLLVFYSNLHIFLAVICIVAVIMLHEFYRISLKNYQEGPKLLGVLLGIIPLIASLSGRPETVSAGLFLSLLLLFCFTICRYSSLKDPFNYMTKLLFGIIYIGFCAAHLVLLRARPEGTDLLLILTSLIIASDSVAYYTGRLFGTKKLCPAVSPGKTVQGFVGGILGGAITGIIMTRLLLPQKNLLPVAAVFIVIAAIGVVGDLTESIIKRSGDTKDSGSILPGHGGVLDRLDSLLITTPVFFYLTYYGIF
ncbi:MAG: phosphatidate cytidylyltransferase [Desulfobulbaceae bacterium]|nr:phosphatidate cytidylyltransferase [Desulfobulbaceae bacterium]MCK5340123.1 phosphatidate cytidylyltransferase [Desulfobulbaceae bacterium]MCK5404155.1 phosphatidate cytidylyltransferase [Desulfobulbaceae bacterium]